MGEFVKLKNIATITMGQSPKSETINMEFNGIPLLQGNSDIKNNKISTKKYTTALKLKTCKKNDILFTVRAGVGDIYIASQTACIGRGFCSINVNNHLENSNKYIFYYLQKYKPQWKQISQGTTFDSINSQHINNLLIPIKIIKEQEKISDYFSNLDTVINNKQRQLELMEKYKEDLLDKIFNQKIRFKDENGFDYPDIFKTNVGYYVSIHTGKLNANCQIENGKYPFFTCSKKISKINQYAFDTECVLISGNGDLDVKYFNGKFNAYQRTYIIESKLIDIKYLFYLYLNLLKKLKQNSCGSVIQFIKLGDINDVNINLPSREEQLKISNILYNVDLEINVLKKSIKNLKEYKIDMLEKMF